MGHQLKPFDARLDEDFINSVVPTPEEQALIDSLDLDAPPTDREREILGDDFLERNKRSVLERVHNEAEMPRYCEHVDWHKDSAQPAIDPPEPEGCTNDAEFIVEHGYGQERMIETCGEHLPEHISDGTSVYLASHHPRQSIGE